MERDEGRILTDEILLEIEKEIRRTFAAASVELMQTIDEHFAKLADKDREMQLLLEAGKITAEQYKQWRLAYIGRGKRFEELRDKLAERVTRANEAAVAYVNDKTPTIYTINRNYAAYRVEKSTRYKYHSFTLLDENTIRRLIMEHPDLMPYYPAKRALARGIDLEYGRKQITAAVTSGIIQGKSTRKIAKDLRNRLVNMNVESAIRTARTAVTAAENGGRADTFKRAADMGIKVTQRWLATLDSRTRPAHRHADGQIRAVGEPFEVGGEKLMFPGDHSLGASGWNIYNCRCGLITETDKQFEREPTMRRARNPETGKWEVIPDMPYDEWEVWSGKRDGNDVLPEYLAYASPEAGRIAYGDGYDRGQHKAEIKVAQWLNNNFGGNIELLRELDTDKKKTPDYLWDGKQWELKTVSSTKAIDSALRSALKQIAEKPGGVILDCSEVEARADELQEAIEYRMQRSGQFSADVIVFRNGKATNVFRYKK